MNQIDIQTFFIRRLVEALHKDTLDSYRVRSNNVMTILCELRDVLHHWLEGKIKNESTIEYCRQECEKLVTEDSCMNYDFYDRELFIKDLQSFKSSNSKNEDKSRESLEKICFLIDACVFHNKDKYLTALFDSMENRLFIEGDIADDQFCPQLRRLDIDLSAFACELLRLGYSKSYLFKYFSSIKEELESVDFIEIYQQIRKQFENPENRSFIVFFKFSVDKNKFAERIASTIDNFTTRIPEPFRSSIKKQNSYLENNNRVCFYMENQKALDPTMAARLSYEDMSKELDMNLETVEGLTMPKNALVLIKENVGYKVSVEKIIILDKSGLGSKEKQENLSSLIKKIENNNKISLEVMSRISSALRHLRIGDSQIEIEQQFINYWIALEFLFASAYSDESTFGRIKKYLPIISESTYIKRNLLYLNEWLKRESVISDEDQFWLKIDADKESISDTPVNVLLKYRMKNMKSHLRQKEAVGKYLKNHKDNLEQHLARIYRLRNELIHEAAITQSIVSVTSNLRSYLVFILNQLIDYFANVNNDDHEDSLSHFFWTYERWLNKIMKDGSMKTIMAVPFSDGIVI